MASKYEPIAHYLRHERGNTLDMSFGQVEQILGFSLPDSARMYEVWWRGEPAALGRHTQAKHGWHSAGWNVADVDLMAESVTFVRTVHGN